MDRAMLEQHLSQAEAHVAEGRAHLERQLKLIADLERDAHDTTQARALLAQFEEVQAMHVADRDRLRKELARERG